MHRRLGRDRRSPKRAVVLRKHAVSVHTAPMVRHDAVPRSAVALRPGAPPEVALPGGPKLHARKRERNRREAPAEVLDQAPHRLVLGGWLHSIRATVRPACLDPGLASLGLAVVAVRDVDPDARVIPSAACVGRAPRRVHHLHGPRRLARRVDGVVGRQVAPGEHPHRGVVGLGDRLMQHDRRDGPAALAARPHMLHRKPLRADVDAGGTRKLQRVHRRPVRDASSVDAEDLLSSAEGLLGLRAERAIDAHRSQTEPAPAKHPVDRHLEFSHALAARSN